MLRTRLLRFGRDTRGTAAMEAGLALPFIILFAAGLFEYGSIFYNYELIQTGVRDAARYLARVPNTAAAEATARNLATRGTVDGTGSLRVRWWQPSDVQITYETTSNPIDTTTGRRLYRGGDTIMVVSVSTSVEYTGLALLSSFNFDPITVTAAHEERYVGE